MAANTINSTIALPGKESSMALSSTLSIASIIAHYSDASVWGHGVCGITLADGTRLVATALGAGFRIFPADNGRAVYVPFA